MNVQHSIHIPSFLKVYDNALDDLGSILQNQGINRVVLYFGNDRDVWFQSDEFFERCTGRCSRI